jgi:hypothetical protein
VEHGEAKGGQGKGVLQDHLGQAQGGEGAIFPQIGLPVQIIGVGDRLRAIGWCESDKLINQPQMNSP